DRRFDMATFLINARDRDDSVALRLQTRDAHLAWVATQADIILMAGPVFGDDGETMIGSTFVVDLPDRAAVDAWRNEDPYVQVNLFGDVEIAPFRWATGRGPKP
ncbi:MAG: YciI family protein, partial [Pseudomonadota bacterium]